MSWLFAPQLRPFVMLAGAASLLLNLALLMPALYMLQVFDRVFSSGSLETLVMLSLLVGLALAFGYFLDTARTRALASAGRALDRRLAPLALTSVLRQAAGSTGRTDDDVLRDVGQLRSFLGGAGIIALFDAPWVPLYLVVIALMHPTLGGAATAGAVVLIALGIVTERLTRTQAERALRTSRATSRRAEALTRNAEAIIGMGMMSAAIASWQVKHRQLLSAQEDLGATSSRLGALARTSRQALQAMMLAVGAWLVLDTQASPGIMVAATILIGRALQPVEALIGGWKALIDARSAARRLEERHVESHHGPSSPTTFGSVQRRLNAPDAGERLALPSPVGRLEVERISFAPSPLRPVVIKAIAFRLAPGESLGLVGPSASGKTTLIRLLLGIWKPQAGIVRLDGADISRWDRDALGKHLGYLPQDVELFAGTVAENIARLGSVDSDRVIEAARLARVHDMILRLPEGYDTQIGDGGAVLSGGQRQRIALARALYGNPRLVVLDEPNAHLDEEGDHALSAALEELKMRGVTVILVGHRPAVMAQLDKLAVLRNGALEAFGPTAAMLPRMRAAAPDAKRIVQFPASDATDALA
jgi:PrtD family type I secretion system ABC transporter